jgi:hypothetical protein
MDQLIFTRYLYPKIDVKESLLIALLEKNSKEALFWAYELYYSGYEDNYEYIHNIYQSFYKTENPDLETKLFSNLNNDDELKLGSIIMTLCSRNYQICEFLRVYKLKTIGPMKHPPSKFKFIIAFSESDLQEYKTKLPENGKTSNYLSQVCKYPIRRECNQIFETTHVDFAKQFSLNWLYYASYSPTWKTRIEEHGGVVNHETREVDFDEDDGSFDEFYDMWGISPDEQSRDLKIKCIGNYKVEQLSMGEFCEKYGGMPKKLENTIVLSE